MRKNIQLHKTAPTKFKEFQSPSIITHTIKNQHSMLSGKEQHKKITGDDPSSLALDTCVQFEYKGQLQRLFHMHVRGAKKSNQTNPESSLDSCTSQTRLEMFLRTLDWGLWMFSRLRVVRHGNGMHLTNQPRGFVKSYRSLPCMIIDSRGDYLEGESSPEDPSQSSLQEDLLVSW